jgi:hypothetical protein
MNQAQRVKARHNIRDRIAMIESNMIQSGALQGANDLLKNDGCKRITELKSELRDISKEVNK